MFQGFKTVRIQVLGKENLRPPQLPGHQWGYGSGIIRTDFFLNRDGGEFWIYLLISNLKRS